MSTEQNRLIQQEFTKQAHAYASNPTISDPDWARRLVTAVSPAANAHILEVATGPGYVAMAFARVADQVVGIDITDAPLAIAKTTKAERDLENVRFEKGDAAQLAFTDGSFDAVVCRLAFHHFANPETVLHEMVRVCRVGGTIAVEDLVASEHTERADYYNRWERLRDPSHTTALSLGQLLAMFAAAGLDLHHVQMERRPQVVEQWLRNSHTPDDDAEQTRQLIEADRIGNISGIPIYDNVTGERCFDHRMVTLVAHKL